MSTVFSYKRDGSYAFFNVPIVTLPMITIAPIICKMVSDSCKNTTPANIEITVIKLARSVALVTDIKLLA